MLETIGFYEPISEVSKEFLGGKGFGLAEMTELGIPVPPAVVIPTTLCVRYHAGETELLTQIADEFFKLHLPKFAHKFGYVPLFSVRSGARVSMPGMMDTILNVGLDTENYDEWQGRLGTDCVLDCRSRLTDMWADVVGGEVPLGLYSQIVHAIAAVFDSWKNDRAIEYRAMHGYSDDWGTAVILQAMVFGNMNDESCSGVMFTRDPATGENDPVGEFLPNAQGEDVVAGTHTPLDICELVTWNTKVHQQLWKVMFDLEEYFRDMQDIEFTVQNGDLFILQTRDAKRTPKAAFKVAVDMVAAGTWTLTNALKKLTAAQYKQLSLVEIVGDCPEPNGTGIPAGGSIVIGKAVFTSAAAVKSKEPCILIRAETDPNDVSGMAAAVGILTATGGKTSHAAVVSRGFGKTCVCGLTDMAVTDSWANIKGDYAIEEGDMVAIDGETGRVWFNSVPEVATLSGGHVGHELMRQVLAEQGKVEVGEVDDISEERAIVIQAANWADPVSSLQALRKACDDDGIDPRQVTVDLRDRVDMNDEDGILFHLAGVHKTSHELGRIVCAQVFEGTRTTGGSGMSYLTSTPTDLPGAEPSSNLDALLKPGVISLDPSVASPDTLATIVAALTAQGIEVATIFAGSARLDEVAFDVLS